MSYWNGDGKHQADYNRLWGKLVPLIGTAKTRRGELLRSAGKLYYDHHNNGGGNIQDDVLDDEFSTLAQYFKIGEYGYFRILQSLKQGNAKDAEVELLFDKVIEIVALADRQLEEVEGDPKKVWEFLNTRWI